MAVVLILLAFSLRLVCGSNSQAEANGGAVITSGLKSISNSVRVQASSLSAVGIGFCKGTFFVLGLPGLKNRNGGVGASLGLVQG